MSITSLQNSINKFWNNTATKRLTVEGMVDISETMRVDAKNNVLKNNQILGVRTYQDLIFVIHGTGMGSQIKVISPNYIRIYDIRSNTILLQHAQWVYGNIAILSDHELVIGYHYYNLKRLYYCFYGMDASKLLRNYVAVTSVCSAGDGGWFSTMYQIGRGIKINQHWKTAPEHCFDCETKKKLMSEDDAKELDCKEEYFHTRASNLSGVEQDISTTPVFNLSTVRFGLQGETITQPTTDMTKCVSNIAKYKIIYSKATLSPSDLGAVGMKISDTCPSIVLKQLGDLVEYKEKAKILNSEYLESRIQNDVFDNNQLKNDSIKIVKPIAAFLAGIETLGAESLAFESLFKDRIWWTPIVFAFGDFPLDDDINWYYEASFLKVEDVAQIFARAAATNKKDITPKSFKAKYVITSKGKGGDTRKFSGNNLTAFSVPYGGCIASKSVCSLKPWAIDALAEIEQRSNGIYIWGWKYSRFSFAGVDFSAKLKLYFVATGDKEATLVDELSLAKTTQPIDGSAKAVDKKDDTWHIHDFFFNGTKIDWITSQVPIDSEINTLSEASTVTWNSNLIESTIGGGQRHHGWDGLLASGPLRQTDLDIGDTSRKYYKGSTRI